ncbi:hypothetical protein ES705_49884 [subsurface metagenome]
MSEDTQPLHALSADAFIKALQGETVLDENGKELNFLSYSTVKIHNVKVEGLIVLGHETFTHSIEILSGQFGNFYINGGEFHNEFSIKGGKFNYLFIVTGEFHKEFSIRGGKFLMDFHIMQGKFHNQFLIYEGEFLGDFVIWNGNFKKVEINGSELLFHHLRLYTEICYEVKIDSMQINQLTFSNRLMNTGSIYLRNLSINGLQFLDFENEGKLLIADVRASGINKMIYRIYDIFCM